MTTRNKIKNHKKIILVLATLLFVVSVFIHLTGDYATYRLLRGIVSYSCLALILFFKKGKNHILVLLFLFFFGTSSVLTVWYENTTMAIIALAFNLFSFLILIRALLPKISFANMGVLLKIIFSLLILVNAYILFQFIEMLRGFTADNVQYAMMLLGAMSLVGLGIAALLYNHTCSTKVSLLFTIAIFTFIFAEVFRAMGYYDIDFGDASVYISRLLIIIGSGMLVDFTIREKTKQEALANRIF